MRDWDHLDEETLDDNAVPPRSLAEYHARWLLDRYGLVPPLSFEQINFIAHEEGMTIVIEPDAEEEGVYRNRPRPHAVLRRADPFTAGHELGHHKWHAQREFAVELYCTWWKPTGEEGFCNDFAAFLTIHPDELQSYGYRSDWDEPGTDEDYDEELP